MKQFSILLFCFFFLFMSTGHAQVFPYLETFDSYPANVPLSGYGGIAASAHVYITAHGMPGNCAEFQMTDTAAAYTDTLTSPLIGPLTAHCATHFLYRVVAYTNGVPAVYHMTPADRAIVYVGGVSGGSIYIPQDTISSANQNTTLSYVDTTIAIPVFLAGYSGRFKIVAYNPAGNNWQLEFDSLQVYDTVPVPPVLRDSVTDVKCRGANTGSITVIATGIAPPFRYLWSTGDTTATTDSLYAGPYSVTVTDRSGVTASLTATVAEPALALIFDSIETTPALCYGENTGTATVYISGGSPGYQYSWSTSPATHSNPATALHAGNYTVTVTDANACFLTASIHISQPQAAFSTTTSTTPPTSGGNGTATATASGGSGAVSYEWNTNPPQRTATATGLSAGYYVVTVTNGTCALIDTVYVPHPSGIGEVGIGALSMYPNPAADQVYIELPAAVAGPVGIAIADLSGRIVMAQDGASRTVDVAALANGVYIVKVNTGAGSYAGRLLIQH